MTNYGTPEYYQEQVDIANERVVMLQEAISTRSKAGTITSGNLVVMAKVLEEAEEALANAIERAQAAAAGGN